MIAHTLITKEQKYIYGVQANIWTEYTGNPAKLEYQLFPRASALSEIAWSPKEAKDWKNFEKKLPTQFKRYELWKTNYSRAYYDLKATITPSANYDALIWTVQTNMDPGKTGISYVIVKSNPNSTTYKTKDSTAQDGKKLQVTNVTLVDESHEYNYTAPIRVTSNGAYTAFLHLKNESGDIYGNQISQVSQQFYFNKATGKKITLTNPPAVEFPGNGGAFGLVNGALTEKYGNFSEWLGWPGGDMEAVIDLGTNETVTKINVHTLDQKRGRYYAPAYVEVFVSTNGTDYTSVGKTSSFVADHDNIGNMSITCSPVAARYIKVFAKNAGTIPEGQPGAGNQARMLVDEIQVD